VGVIVADISVYPLEEFDYSADSRRVKEISVHGGGDAFNTAVDAARLGCQTAFMGCVGQDSLGDLLENALKKEGVFADSLRRIASAPTSASVVLSNAAGARSFLSTGTGAASHLCSGHLDMPLIARSKVVFVGGGLHLPKLDGQPMAEMFRFAKANGAITAMDVMHDRSGRWLETLDPVFPYLDWFLPSEVEVRQMTGKKDRPAMIETLMKHGVKNLVMKIGKEGCLVSQNGRMSYVPSFKTQVVDTCGAGDAFNAGFLTGLLRGKTPVEAAKLGSAVSSMCISGVGATQNVGSLAEAQAIVNCRELNL